MRRTYPTGRHAMLVQLLLQHLAAAQQGTGAGEGDGLDGVQPGFQVRRHSFP